MAAYAYHPEDDPGGASGGAPVDDPDGRGGYLARVTVDASGAPITTAYTYYAAGRLTRVIDAAGSHAELAYSPSGQVEETRGRLAGHTLRKHYDEIGNLVASIRPFTHLVHDDATGTIAPEPAAITERREYDALDQLIARTIEGGGTRIIGRVERDADGRVTRHVQPEGGVTEYVHDERGLVILRTLGAGTPEAATERYTWTPDGSLRSRIDARGNSTVWTYDGFGRCTGVADAAGTTWTQRLDPTGNTVLLMVTGTKKGDLAPILKTAVDTAAAEPTARVGYRFGGQVAWLELGGEVMARCGYDTDQRLTSVEYHRVTDGALVEGFRYRYDASGMPVEAVRSTPGGDSAERSWHDAGGRPRLALDDVEDPADPRSAFGSETTYEPLPEGLWARRVDRDARAPYWRTGPATSTTETATAGSAWTIWRPTLSGDIVRRTGPHGTCVYTYDGEHRLVRLERYDRAGQVRLTVTYGYDPLGRLVTRTVIDAVGVTTEHAYVWAGDVLVEEYENGLLARSYLHSVGSLPALLRTWRPVRADHLYVIDGRGLVSGLVGIGGSNAFAEKYGYELTGAPFLTEIAGVPIALPDRDTTSSTLLNGVMSGTPGVLQDWQTRLLAGLGGRQLDPRVAGALNGVSRITGKSHSGVRDTLAAQLGDMLAMLGLGGRAQPPTLSGTGGFGRGLSQYAAGDTPLGDPPLVPPPREPANPAFDFSGRGSRAPQSGSSVFKDIQTFLDKPVPLPGPAGELETNYGALIGGALGGLNPSDRAKDAPAPGANTSGTGGPSQAEKNAQEEAEKQKREQQKKENEEAEKKKSIVEEGDKYPADPSIITLRTAAVVAAELNGIKHPVNPNDSEKPTLDLSSPPPRQGGMDPTIAYFDGDTLYGGWAGGSETPRLTRAPIDFVQGHENLQPGPPNPGAGGDIDPKAHRP